MNALLTDPKLDESRLRCIVTSVWQGQNNDAFLKPLASAAATFLQRKQHHTAVQACLRHAAHVGQCGDGETEVGSDAELTAKAMQLAKYVHDGHDVLKNAQTQDRGWACILLCAAAHMCSDDDAAHTARCDGFWALARRAAATDAVWYISETAMANACAKDVGILDQYLTLLLSEVRAGAANCKAGGQRIRTLGTQPGYVSFL